MNNYVEFETLKGKTLKSIEGAEEQSERIEFKTTDGEIYCLLHVQDCCESVSVEDICGDVEDLIGTPITMAEEVSNYDDPPTSKYGNNYNPESYTWTFYKIGTKKGDITIRWYGDSNGCYSEMATFVKTK